MHIIHCPTCKRVLHAPDESGEHRVVCPGCNVSFAVVFEDGVVRTLSISVSTEEPSEKPTPLVEVDEPPVWLPAINVSVYEDEGLRRTRRIHAWFAVGFLGSFAFFAFMLSTERRPPSWLEFLALLPAVGFVACLIGGAFALVVGNLISYKPESYKESYKQGEEALNRMWKALRADDPAPDDSEAPRPPRPVDPSPTDVAPKDPPG
jgi:uncharacterized protein YbaR (Trm112 family)